MDEYIRLANYHGYEIYKLITDKKFKGYVAADEDDYINEVPAKTLKEVHEIIDGETNLSD